MVALTKTYGAFGAHDATRGVVRTAYAGEVSESDTGWYLLGERAYSPTLRRFIAPDRLSPFGIGGVNRYAYCGGDPINRIDPSGNMWSIWQGRSQGLSGRGSAVRSTSATSQRLAAATITPGTLSAFAAANAAATSVVASIGPSAVATSARTAPNGVLLPTMRGTNAAADATAFPPPKRHMPGRPVVEREERVTYPQQPRRTDPKIYLNLGMNVPQNRLGTLPNGNRYVTPKWNAHQHTDNPKSWILAADTPVFQHTLAGLLDKARSLGAKRLNVYTDVHGNSWGENYDIESLQQPSSDPRIRSEVTDFLQQNSANYGLQVTIKNIGGWSIEDIRDEVSKNGLHSFTACYGVADKALRPLLNLSQIVLYNV
jgi:RHS repeat-associated protein